MPRRGRGKRGKPKDVGNPGNDSAKEWFYRIKAVSIITARRRKTTPFALKRTSIAAKLRLACQDGVFRGKSRVYRAEMEAFRGKTALFALRWSSIATKLPFSKKDTSPPSFFAGAPKAGFKPMPGARRSARHGKTAFGAIARRFFENQTLPCLPLRISAVYQRFLGIRLGVYRARARFLARSITATREIWQVSCFLPFLRGDVCFCRSFSPFCV